MKKEQRKLAEKHTDKKLRFRLKIYFLISFAMLGVVIFEIITHAVTIPLAFVAIILGAVLGVIVARMFRISWNHDAKQVASQLDVFGIAILALYILFSIFRGRIVGYFIHGPAIGGFSMSLVAGVMIGRTIGTRGKIIKILKEQRVFQ